MLRKQFGAEDFKTAARKVVRKHARQNAKKRTKETVCLAVVFSPKLAMKKRSKKQRRVEPECPLKFAVQIVAKKQAAITLDKNSKEGSSKG